MKLTRHREAIKDLEHALPDRDSIQLREALVECYEAVNEPEKAKSHRIVAEKMKEDARRSKARRINRTLT